ncbi:DUF6497 family protein [Leisingera aquaemixtae]|uniref:Acetolactate synthase n=1 Tax=Leisingera aquaemixtae TaxID=1396826 RepID=A0A0P1H9H2_9RHOB|nr:DUF6497 family protein [Leisingera aquaemixtae]UWQ26017.1 hypothetical protein K3553_06045 [Leisingera aquaemixtae]CUH99652.1 hypothetical protein PHA8399_01774 [Leisingera aquaemixtae]
MIRSSRYQTARATCAAPAAPAGGARETGGRGCGYLAAIPFALIAQAALAADAIAVPSGQLVTLAEVLLDEAPGQPGQPPQLWARFRFLAPQIARGTGTVSYDTAAPDMDHLCGSLALPYLAEHGMTAARVVISLSDRELPFGAQDPEATQFFEAYRPDGAACMWEAF